MEKPEYIKNSMEKIRDCLQDYSNDFMAINLIYMGSGINGVRNLIKNGYKVQTVEEYLEKYREDKRVTIGIEDQKNPIFIEKTKELNKLAEKINSLGEKINDQVVSETIEKVKTIIHF